MDPATFVRTPGQIIAGLHTQWGSKGEAEYRFYVPPPIPRQLDLSSATLTALSLADQRVGALLFLDRLMPNPHLLISPYLRKEAVLSSKIEGTQASLSDVLQEEAHGPAKDRPKDVREVINYVHALEEGRMHIRQQPLDLVLVRSLHRTLLSGVRGHDLHPGEFRTYQNWIGPDGTPLEEARYVPPAPEHMDRCLKDFEGYLLDPPRFPLLLQTALLHYQFEAIHPFGDGNGRVGRLLIPLFLLHRKVLSSPLLYMSAYFERNRTAYYDRLHAVQTNGDYEGWLRFFLDGVALQADDAAQCALRIADLHKHYREDLSAANATAASFSLLDRLFENPYTSIPQAVKDLGTTFPTAQRAIEKYLVPLGVLERMSHLEHPRMYVATRIFDVIQEGL